MSSVMVLHLHVEYRHRPTMNDIITELNDTQDMYAWKYDSINSIKVCFIGGAV